MKKMQKTRKIVAAILTVVLLFSSMGVPVFATETDGQPQAEMMTEERNVESTEETVDVNETEPEATPQPENTEEQAGNGEVPTEEFESEETQTEETQPQNPEIEPETEPQVQEEEPETEKPETDGAVPETEVPAVGTKPQMQVPQMTEPSASESTSVEEETLDLEKSGNVFVDSVQFLESKTREDEVTTKLTDNVTFELAATLDGEAKSVWLGYRITLPKKSPSGGSYSFVAGTYPWLRTWDGNGQAVAKTEGENWVLEGKALAQQTDGNIAPGVFSPSLTVHAADLVNNETAQLTGECWLIDEEASKKTATATMTAQGISEYYATNHLRTPALISGYFNETTGDFSIYEPEQPEGYVYGRVYIVRARVKNSSATERLDPTKPISYDLDYKLLKKENGVEEEVTDPRLQPVLMAAKRDNNEVKENQLEGAPVKEFTLNGCVKDLSGDDGPYRGEYVLSKAPSENRIHVSATLSTDKEYRQQRNASIYTLFFIPVDEADEENGKNISYKFQVETTKLEGTSYSGSPIVADLTRTDNKKTVIVPPAVKEENIPQQGLFSRSSYFDSSQQTTQRQKTVGANIELTNNSPNNIVDYKIYAVNMLLKFEGGLTLQNIISRMDSYTGNCTFLYGIKPNGSGWKDEVELNHTQDYELRYYDSYEKAAANGTVVAVLAECREGIWATGNLLAFYPKFMATGDSTTFQVIVQDIKVWRNIKGIASWKGTNGKPVEQEIQPTDFMKPYDNPNNKVEPEENRVYRKDVWQDNEVTPTMREGHTWGDTIYILDGLIEALPRSDKDYPTKNLNGNVGEIINGWNNSIFDVSLGQRMVDRVYCFQVTGVGNQELTLKAIVGKGQNDIKQTGPVYLSTDEKPVTYIPNADPTKPGTFQGGTEIDPEHFTIPGDGKYRIYFSSFIGNEEDLSKDVPPGVYYNDTSLQAIGNTLRYANVGDTYLTHATTVTRTTTTSVAKSSISETTTDKAGYTLTLDSYNTSIKNTFILDILPYNNDDVGSQFHGSYSLSGNQIQVSYQSMQGTAKTKMRLFYTTDENIRSVTGGKRIDAHIFKGIDAKTISSSFQAGNVTWQEATANADSTVFTFPKGTTPTAVVFAGTAEGEERMKATISLALKDHEIGDTYNNISSTQFGVLDSAIPSEVAKVSVIGRDVSGKAWADQNKNGIYDEGDAVLSKVRVRLYQADGTEITADVNHKSYGEILTGADGSYRFEKVPESPDGYYIEFESTTDVSLKNYQTVEQYAGDAQSPYEKAEDSDVVFHDTPQEKVKTDVFTLLSDDELSNGELVQKAEGINAGFEKALTIQAEKEWKGKTEQQVTVQLQRRKGTDSQWENIVTRYLNEGNTWKTSFEQQPPLYKDTAVGRYEYRVVELDGSQTAVEAGGQILLNGNTYQVQYETTPDNTWKITNSSLLDLTVEKEVVGELGDRTKKFTIEISAQDSKGKPMNGTFSCEGAGNIKNIEFRNGKAEIELAHTEKITIKDLPYDSQITVTEKKADGYTVAYAINKGENQESATLSLTKDSEVKVINKKTDIPDTGIFHSSTGTGILVFIGILGIAFVGISVFRKRKGLR